MSAKVEATSLFPTVADPGDGRSPAQRYRYVDFAARAQPGFRNHVVTVDQVPGLVERWGAGECYASIFRFSADILRYLASHRVDGRASIAGYDGPIWAPFLPLDIDAHPPASTLTNALQLARRIHALLIERWRVPPEALHPYFSGNKGFHILIDTRAAGRVAPAANLHRVFVRVRLDLLAELPAAARPLFDLVIGDKVRLLRLPNTRHAESGLFKIALTPQELHGLSGTQIRALAHAPRPLLRVAAGGLEPREPVAPAPVLVEHFARARRDLRREAVHPHGTAAPPSHPEEPLCEARRAMWRADLAPGMRNNAAIRLASAFRLAGLDRAQTLQLLHGWAERQSQPLPEEEIGSVVQSAYARPYAYMYGCHDEVIRRFCPYAARLDDCSDYHSAHPRSERSF